VFATVIQANHITKKDDKMAAASLTDDDIRAVVQLSRDERIGERVSRICQTMLFLGMLIPFFGKPVNQSIFIYLM